MLEISSKSVRDVVSHCSFITQTIIPEVYRVYDGNKKGVIGAPTVICNGGQGSLFIADINGGLYSARLHYPVDVCEIEKGLSMPLGIAHSKGVLYVAENGKGKIRVIDTVGNTVYNPNLLTVKDLKSVLRNLGVSFTASATKDVLKTCLKETLLAKSGSDYIEKQKYLLDTELKKPAALHLCDNGKIMYVSDLDLKQIISIQVNIDGIFARSVILGKIDFPGGDILSLSSKDNKLYLAATGEHGGIFEVYKEHVQSSAQPENYDRIISNRSSVCGDVSHYPDLF